MMLYKKVTGHTAPPPHAQNLPASCQSLQAAFCFAYVGEGYAVAQLHEIKKYVLHASMTPYFIIPCTV
jgi:hypothetical protein